MKNARLLLVTRALSGIAHLPPGERADLFEAAADVLSTTAPTEAALATQAAAHLREGEAAQLHFMSSIGTPETAPHSRS